MTDNTIIGDSATDILIGTLGDDLILGLGGNDSIIGDGPEAPPSVRESFSWILQSEQQLNGTVTQDTGTVGVAFSRADGAGASSLDPTTTAINVDGVDGGSETVSPNSSAVLNGEAGFELNFSAEVENVSFNITDLDGDSTVTVLAFDAAGNLIDLDLTAASGITL